MPLTCTIAWQDVCSITITTDSSVVQRVHLERTVTDGESTGHSHSPALMRQTVAQIQAYLSGERRFFSVPLAFPKHTTPFQQAVWESLRRIPFGSICTYSQLAAQISLPKAARAVGNALAANPLPILVPCHRVVSGSGLGGFMGNVLGGTRIKRALLALEGVQIG
jgi:methylated-DNA-[protein]-cysteine S-methyltransferase